MIGWLRWVPHIALVGAVWWLVDLVNDRTQLRADLAAVKSDLSSKNAELERAAETARIHRAHLDRASDEARGWVALSNDLQSMEGRDAPLSPLLSATARRLFRSGQ